MWISKHNPMPKIVIVAAVLSVFSVACQNDAARSASSTVPSVASEPSHVSRPYEFVASQSACARPVGSNDTPNQEVCLEEDCYLKLVETFASRTARLDLNARLSAFLGAVYARRGNKDGSRALLDRALARAMALDPDPVKISPQVEAVESSKSAVLSAVMSDHFASGLGHLVLDELRGMPVEEAEIKIDTVKGLIWLMPDGPEYDYWKWPLLNIAQFAHDSEMGLFPESARWRTRIKLVEIKTGLGLLEDAETALEPVLNDIDTTYRSVLLYELAAGYLERGQLEKAEQIAASLEPFQYALYNNHLIDFYIRNGRKLEAISVYRERPTERRWTYVKLLANDARDGDKASRDKLIQMTIKNLNDGYMRHFGLGLDAMLENGLTDEVRLILEVSERHFARGNEENRYSLARHYRALNLTEPFFCWASQDLLLLENSIGTINEIGLGFRNFATFRQLRTSSPQEPLGKN